MHTDWDMRYSEAGYAYGTAPDVEIYVPMRVVANGAGSEVLFTLFRMPGVTDEEYAADTGLLEQDLGTLKQLMESNRE